MIHTVKGIGIVNKAEVDVFLKLPCFFNDPMDVGSLISHPLPFLNPAWTSGSSPFMYFWSLAWRILSITLLACEMSAAFSGIAFLWDWNENWPFPVYGHCRVFQICWHIDCSTFTASSFRIWNSYTVIPSPPLALFIVSFLRPTWLHIPGCLALHESWTYIFFTVLLHILATSS